MKLKWNNALQNNKYEIWHFKVYSMWWFSFYYTLNYKCHIVCSDKSYKKKRQIIDYIFDNIFDKSK
jgi:hypothetical protein